MDADAGELVVLPFPYTDLSSSKQRPALVLSPAWYNQENEDALFAYVTSVPQSPEDPLALHVTGQQLESGTLVKPSWVRTDKLFTIDQQLVRKAVARLDATTLGQVRRRATALISGTRPNA